MDLINIFLGFIEGFGLIISPCILPVLPIILSGSLTGSKKRPVGIVFGFIITFSLITFFSRQLVQYSGISFDLLRYFSYGLLFFFGLIMMSSYLTEKFAALTQRLANTGSSLSTINDPNQGFFSGIFFGGLVAIIWTPCAGPILASVIVQIAIQKSSLIGFLTLLVFSLGAAVPMLIIALFGRRIMATFSFFKTRTVLFRKALGAIIMLSVFYLILSQSISLSSAQVKTSNNVSEIQHGLLTSYLAPPIEGIDAWINSPPLKINELKGKVVLIDFWTYSCINCIRTLPYLKDWYAKYHNKGLVIIGVHAPEFEFEKNLSNVQTAVLNDGILYPVALDNHFVTWQNYHNQYWPAHYLINRDGYVVYQHFGEGNYDITENNIRALLGAKSSSVPMTSLAEENLSSNQTPETYLGYWRSERYTSPETVKQNGVLSYSFPTKLYENQWALEGNWWVDRDRIVSGLGSSSVKINFNAKKVFVVMGSASGRSIEVKVLFNGQPITKVNGKDVVKGAVVVGKHKLYEVVVLPKYGTGILQLTTFAPGLEIYTFTFGG